MPPIVVDTDVLSFLAKGDSRAASYAPLLTGARPCVCFQTIAELRLWSLVRGWGAARWNTLDQFLQGFVVLPYDSLMAQRWAEVTAARRAIGRPINCGDAWIAAAAMRHGATLITHNAKDYADISGLTVIVTV